MRGHPRKVFKVCAGRVMGSYRSLADCGQANYITRQGVCYYCRQAMAGKVRWLSDADGRPYTFCYAEQLGRLVTNEETAS